MVAVDWMIWRRLTIGVARRWTYHYCLKQVVGVVLLLVLGVRGAWGFSLLVGIGPVYWGGFAYPPFWGGSLVVGGGGPKPHQVLYY